MVKIIISEKYREELDWRDRGVAFIFDKVKLRSEE